MHLQTDKTNLEADGADLAFVTISILDENGNIVPVADNLIEFEVLGNGKLVGVDNGNPVSHRSMKGNRMEAMNGKCLAVIQASKSAGKVHLKAASEGLQSADILLSVE